MGRRLDQITTVVAVILIIFLSAVLVNRLNSLLYETGSLDLLHLFEEHHEKDQLQLQEKSLKASVPGGDFVDEDCKFGFHFLRSFIKPGGRKKKKDTRRVTIRRPVSGALRQTKTCMDSMDGGVDSIVGMYECHGQGRNQEWTLTTTMLIESNGQSKLCLFYQKKKGSSILMKQCNAEDKQQKWIINSEKGKINPVQDRLLCVDSSKGLLTAEKCQSNKKSQEWTFIVTEILSLEIQSQNHM